MMIHSKNVSRYVLVLCRYLKNTTLSIATFLDLCFKDKRYTNLDGLSVSAVIGH